MADPVLVGRLRKLLTFAAARGAPEDELKAWATDLVDALLELEAYRLGHRDPRRQRSLTRAKDLARSRAHGATIDQLCARTGYCRQHVYRLLRLAASVT